MDAFGINCKSLLFPFGFSTFIRKKKMEYRSTLTLIAQSDIMRNLLVQVETAAKSDSSVLLVGETGVGKELFAEFIHKKVHAQIFHS